jgi:hypothetical protein
MINSGGWCWFGLLLVMVCRSAAFSVAALVGFWAAFFCKVFLYVGASFRRLGKEKPPFMGGFSGLGL